MRYFSCLFFFLLFVVACPRQPTLVIQTNDPLIAVDSLNRQIRIDLERKGSADLSQWNEHQLWSAIAHADSIVAIGYQPLGFLATSDWISTIDLSAASWKQARQQVIGLLANELNASRIIWVEDRLPVILLRLSSKTQLQRLRRSPYVRYVEPLSYDHNLVRDGVQLGSSSGCGSNTPDYGIQLGTHYSSIAPAAKLSWNYAGHGIPQAWARTTGRGIKVFVIDSGCSWAQDNLGISFNSGASYGRTLERIVTLPQDTWMGFSFGNPETSNDGCGHGTSMAGVIAAPRCSDGNAVGIAYNCNLVTCRAATDVFLDEAREVKGVVDAFTNAANRSDVRIISMSMGRITSSSYMVDAIRYAYGKGKLIFTAAGTSFGWTSGWAGVIFPARMPEIQAVTGVKDLSALSACAVCHTGQEVDFVVTMERNADGDHPLTVADSGDWPSSVGGSSVATASMAGMAALLWSRYPTFSRDQIIVRLQQSSSLYPYKNAQFGWGRVNVDRATQ